MMSNSPESHADDRSLSAEFLRPAEPRRGFLVRAASLTIGGVVGLVPAAVGLATFLNPLRKSVRDQQRPSGSDSDGYFKLATLDAVTDVPQAFKIIADRKDAWNTYPESAIGAVFIQKMEGDKLRVFNVTCPHAGCSVDYRGSTQRFHCPCHSSTFEADGKRDPRSPSARNLDELDYRIVDGTVWVRFQNFKPGVAEKKAV